MKKVLIFPLLNSMPSGHHQVADTVCESIFVNSGEIEYKKLDILSEWNNLIEKMIVKVYLRWIRRFPASYAWIYRTFAYRSKSGQIHKLYELLFLKKIEQILEREKPDLIVSTHGFPSLFINRLKQNGKCAVPCLNIYTDFFINDVWGCKQIDYHFVPSSQIKEELLAKYNIDEKRIFVSGIPVSNKFETMNQPKTKDCGEPFQLLLSGGSAGLGNIVELLKKSNREMVCHVKVLCGANKKLYEDIQLMQSEFVEAYPYISSKEEMNSIYETVDAIISKPGGVTVSEAIRKEIPIFISNALPGQEQINLQLLKDMGLVFIIPENVDALEFACRTLGDKEKMHNFQLAAARYRDSFDLKDSRKLFETIESMLKTS